MISVEIVGGTACIGVQFSRLRALHSCAEIVAMTSRGTAVSESYPCLRKRGHRDCLLAVRRPQGGLSAGRAVANRRLLQGRGWVGDSEHGYYSRLAGR